MQLPFRLTRRTTLQPVTALLFFTRDPNELLQLCASMKLDPLPDIFDTADGFLILLGHSTTRLWPRTLRLRQLSEFLLLPADADLEPQLLDEEADQLIRDRGYVFLAGQRVLTFGPDSPLPLTALLSAGTVRRDHCAALPAAPPLLTEIRSITLDLPHSSPDDIVNIGGEGVATDDPRPDARGPVETAANMVRMGLGRILSRLGQTFRLRSLRKRGERMVERAAAAVPRLSEHLHGAQEAALRDLLKLFRSGEIEKALRRAIPRVEEGGHRGRVDSRAILPTHNLNYSLGDLLRSNDRSAEYWMDHDAIFSQLYIEYRRVAEEAAGRGDFRRAAFIYGKLLSDWRSAADVLVRGGLHHDAAILFRDKLSDFRRAATQFEEAGEFDDALTLYDQHDLFEEAGDLLRRMGNEPAAIERYLCAAESMASSDGTYLRAGEFVEQKTGRLDLAENYYASGWNARLLSSSSSDVVSCAVHLARVFASGTRSGRFLELLSEAEAYFSPPGNLVAAGRVMNALALYSDRQSFDQCRIEIRDRCLQTIATKLREHAAHEHRAGSVVSTLLGTAGGWPAAVVRDAAEALKTAVKEPPRTGRSDIPVTVLHLGHGTITAARVAPHSGEVIVGFDSGTVVCFHAGETRITRIGDCRASVTALASTLGGDFIVASSNDDNRVLLTGFARQGGSKFQPAGERLLQVISSTGLAPLVLSHDGEVSTIVRYGSDELELGCCRGPELLTSGFSTLTSETGDQWPIDLPLPKRIPECPGLAVLVLQKGEASVVQIRDGSAERERLHCGANVNWVPHLPATSTLARPPVSWFQHLPDRVEVAGLGEDDSVYWLDLRLDRNGVKNWQLVAGGSREGYRAVMLIRPGVMVGVTSQNRLVWLRVVGDRLIEWSPSQRLTTLSPAVACFYSVPTQELIVLLANGYLVRVPVPA